MLLSCTPTKFIPFILFNWFAKILPQYPYPIRTIFSFYFLKEFKTLTIFFNSLFFSNGWIGIDTHSSAYFSAFKYLPFTNF